MKETKVKKGSILLLSRRVLFFPLSNRYFELVFKKGKKSAEEEIFIKVHPGLLYLITTLLLACHCILVMSVMGEIQVINGGILPSSLGQDSAKNSV